MAGFWSWLAKVVCCSSRSATTDGPRDPELLSNQTICNKSILLSYTFSRCHLHATALFLPESYNFMYCNIYVHCVV